MPGHTKTQPRISGVSQLDNVWLQPPYITTPATLQNPDYGLLDAVRPVVEAVGMTELTSAYPALRAYFQVTARAKLLDDIMHQFTTWASEHASDMAQQQEYDFLLLVEKLGQEIDFVDSIRSQLDILRTVDHRPLGDAIWQTLNAKTPLQVWDNYLRDNSEKSVRLRYSFDKSPAFRDEATRILQQLSLKSRRSYQIQRLLNGVSTAHRKGWYIVFDTITLSDACVDEFYQNPTALRDYFRDIGRLVLEAEGRKKGDSYEDCFEYFCVPEYGTKFGRLHFHAIYLMRTLPKNTVDPNLGKVTRSRRQLDTLLGLWPYGFNEPIAVRYSQDAFTRLGWFWPVDKTGKPLKANSYHAVAYYVAKYVNKKISQDYIKLNVGANEWNEQLRQRLLSIPKKVFRTRMSRRFGLKLPSMAKLSRSSLLEMTKLHFSVSPMSSLLKKSARKELRSRLGRLSIADLLAVKPAPTNLLKFLRHSMQATQGFNPLSFIDIVTPKLKNTDISDETRQFLEAHGLSKAAFEEQRQRFGSK